MKEKILSSRNRTLVRAEFEGVIRDLYHFVHHRDNLKIQANYLARICRLQRKMVTSAILKKRLGK